MTRDELIEAMARGMCQDTLDRHGACYDACEQTGKCCGQDISIPDAAAALSALEAALGIDLTAIAEGRAVVVPASRTFGLVTFCACPIGQEEECSHNQCARAVLAARGK